jgi:hypothetical protein
MEKFLTPLMVVKLGTSNWSKKALFSERLLLWIKTLVLLAQ